MTDARHLRKVVLGQIGLDYVQSRLQHGHRLAAVVAARVERTGGVATTYLPPGLPREAIENFRSGGKLRQGAARAAPGGSVAIEVVNAYPALVKLIEDHLRFSTSSVVVIENANARRGDAYLAHQKSRLAYFGEEVLHILRPEDSSSDVEVAIRESKAIPTFLGLFTSLPNADAAAHEFTQKQLQDLARAASAVFAGAYDGEGFIMVDLVR